MSHTIRPLIRTALLCASVLLPVAASAQADGKQVEELQRTQQRVLRELDFAREQRSEAQAKLAQSQSELAEKQLQLKQLEKSLAQGASQTQLESLKVDQQRLTVAELSVESQVAKLERLERKEAELAESLKQAKSRIHELTDASRIAAREASAQQERDLAKLQQQIQQLKNQNMSLEIAVAEEQQRRIRAETRVGELVAHNDKLAQQVKTLELEITAFTEPPTAPATTTGSTRLGLENMVLEGEEPIYLGEDGERIVMRSRSIADNVELAQIGPSLYEANVTVEPGRAYFDLRKRRYRGVFPEDYSGQYRFIYDLADPEAPVLTVETAPETSALATGSADGF